MNIEFFNLKKNVLDFAVEAHTGQTRKYTGEDYIVHPMAVADMVERHGGDEVQVCAALLHDVVEDTPVTNDDIRDNFGDDIAIMVQWLTDTSKPSDGNRRIRKGIDAKRLAEAPAEAQFVKLADMIDNASTIFRFDKAFTKQFKKEMAHLVEVMTKVHGSSLHIEATKVLKT
jgi:(p)ppGpp synthase/HD superfamily hydrolase|tara:strand:+ start:415 stop:930 length:516 start_codon:yes stop_codon:yes gene_type:complete